AHPEREQPQREPGRKRQDERGHGHGVPSAVDGKPDDAKDQRKDCPESQHAGEQRNAILAAKQPVQAVALARPFGSGRQVPGNGTISRASPAPDSARESHGRPFNGWRCPNLRSATTRRPPAARKTKSAIAPRLIQLDRGLRIARQKRSGLPRSPIRMTPPTAM